MQTGSCTISHSQFRANARPASGARKSHAGREVSRLRTAHSSAPGYNWTLRSRNELPTTERELRVIAALAQMGLTSRPKKGYSTPAATGTLKAL